MVDASLLRQIRDLTLEAKSIVALTGANISAESGIPASRQTQSSLWAKVSPEVIALA